MVKNIDVRVDLGVDFPWLFYTVPKAFLEMLSEVLGVHHTTQRARGGVGLRQVHHFFRVCEQLVHDTSGRSGPADPITSVCRGTEKQTHEDKSNPGMGSNKVDQCCHGDFGRTANECYASTV